MLEGILFSTCFCIFFAVTFLVLQASRLEECFKRGKVLHIRIAYFLISFIVGFLMAFGINYIVSLFSF